MPMMSEAELRLEAVELRVSALEISASSSRCTTTHLEGLVHAATTRLAFALEQLKMLQDIVHDMAALLMPLPHQLACLSESLTTKDESPSRHRFTIAGPEVTKEQQQKFKNFCDEV